MPSAGATAMKRRVTAPRESAYPKVVEASDIDTAVNAANSARAATPSTWSGIAASSRMPTPAEPPMPWIRPMPYACHGERPMSWRCAWSSPRRQRSSSRNARAMITKPIATSAAVCRDSGR